MLCISAAPLSGAQAELQLRLALRKLLVSTSGVLPVCPSLLFKSSLVQTIDTTLKQLQLQVVYYF
jgi:hypothetical protein